MFKSCSCLCRGRWNAGAGWTGPLFYHQDVNASCSLTIVIISSGNEASLSNDFKNRRKLCRIRWSTVWALLESKPGRREANDVHREDYRTWSPFCKTAKLRGHRFSGWDKLFKCLKYSHFAFLIISWICIEPESVPFRIFPPHYSHKLRLLFIVNVDIDPTVEYAI